MSIARIGETQAKPQSTEALRDFLLSIMPGIKSSQGCEVRHAISISRRSNQVHDDRNLG